MDDNELTVKYWLTQGWSTVRLHPRLMLGGAIIYASSYFAAGLLDVWSLGYYPRLVIQLIVQPVLSVGWWYFCLRLVRGDSIRVWNIFDSFRLFGRVMLTFVFSTVIIVAGFCLLVVPGIIWLLKYQLSLFIIMDTQLAPHKSIALSGRMTDGHKSKLCILFFLGFLTMFLAWPFALGLQKLREPQAVVYLTVGIIPYLLAFLVINPWLTAALATAYDVLSKRYDTSGSNLENRLLD